LNVYELAELSDTAKNKAYYNWLETTDDHILTANEGLDSLKAFCDLFDCAASGYDWERKTAKIQYSETCELTGKLAHRHINKTHDKLLKWKKRYACRMPDGNLRHNCVGYNCITRKSNIFKEISCPLTGMCYDMSLTDGLKKYLRRPYKKTETVRDVLDNCIEDFLSEMQEICEHETSMERFEETAKDNEEFFFETGEICKSA